ncbi:trichothecene 3-O-acetyltransferase [Verticillium alfalfae VaMs.102]|uniref:Trichothecene 3-O-acetyltransferase n=1 Tax=Verticillium alfalfae (strain VaMs.102 / ATCC MYA-4576 / FGSC 10136) TaxID=526221 RepID=C9SXY7_VERA1|nr:trichothecene 3-O-acetyltransferase [Verticillium alfalfae VaMs.102]EEY23652.1 trichothecene 3-O-acetyltransferase [Verticillium alfalfae VaMs.102]
MDGPPADNLLDDFPIDRLGLQPLIKIYTQICHIYAMPDDSESARANVIETLTRGLERLSAAFPWAAGKMVTVRDEAAGKEEMYIRPHEKIPLLKQRDARDDPEAPTYDALEQARFPINMLDESLIAPIATFPLPDPNETSPVDPIFAIQATFLRGGLILCFAAHHGAMDMNSQARLIGFLSRACRDTPTSPFTEEDLAIGNLRRTEAIRLMDDEEYAAMDPDLLTPHILPAPRSLQANDEMVEMLTDPSFPLGKCVWANFELPLSTQAELKKRVLTSGALPPDMHFVSTDDVLTAFVWSAITRTRLPRLRKAGIATAGIARAVDARRFLPISPDYLGLLSTMTYATVPLDTLAEPFDGKGLAVVSAALRRELEPRRSWWAAARAPCLVHGPHARPDGRQLDGGDGSEERRHAELVGWRGIVRAVVCAGVGAAGECA